MKVSNILLFLNGEALNFCKLMILPDFFPKIWEIWLSPGKNGENVRKFIAIFRNLSQFITMFLGLEKYQFPPLPWVPTKQKHGGETVKRERGLVLRIIMEVEWVPTSQGCTRPHSAPLGPGISRVLVPWFPWTFCLIKVMLYHKTKLWVRTLHGSSEHHHPKNRPHWARRGPWAGGELTLSIFRNFINFSQFSQFIAIFRNFSQFFAIFGAILGEIFIISGGIGSQPGVNWGQNFEFFKSHIFEIGILCRFQIYCSFWMGKHWIFVNWWFLPDFFPKNWEIWLSPGKNGENVRKFIAIFRNLSQFFAIFFGPRKISFPPPLRRIRRRRDRFAQIKF